MIKTSSYFGDCLEGIGIPSKGEVAYDTELKPEVFDLVICDNEYGGGIGALMKECIRTGERPVVHTRYKDCSRNYAFAPAEVFGVVTEVRSENGDIVYKRFKSDDSASPAHLANSFMYKTIRDTQYRYDAAFRNCDKWEVLHRLLRRLDILNFLLQLVRKELKSK
jgi:hypothetical protein